MDKDRISARSVAEVRRAAAAFAQPIGEQGVLQLLTSFGPFIAACVAMYLVFPISYPLTLALAVPTGALLVRIFIIQHVAYVVIAIPLGDPRRRGSDMKPHREHYLWLVKMWDSTAA
jgi:hypothetical protein